MSALLRRPVFRVPVVLLLLLVTQVAFAGEACHRAMPGDMRGGAMAAASIATQPSLTLAGQAPCCAPEPAPATTCVAAFDGTAMTPVINRADVPAFASFAIARTAVATPAPSVRPVFPPATLAGIVVPVYISYQRFLS